MVHERIGAFLKEHGSQLSLAQRSKLHMLQILLSKKGASRRIVAYVAAAAAVTLAAIVAVVMHRRKAKSTDNSPSTHVSSVLPVGNGKKLSGSVQTYARPVIGAVAQKMYAPDRDDVVLRGVSDEQVAELGGQEWVNQQIDERIAVGATRPELTTDAFNALGGEQQGFILALNALNTAKIAAQVKEARKIKEVQEKLSVSREARRSARKQFADLKGDVDHAIEKSESREGIDKEAYNARALTLDEMFSGKEPFVLSKKQLPAVVEEIKELSRLAEQLDVVVKELQGAEILKNRIAQPGDVAPQVADYQRRVAKRLSELATVRQQAEEQIAKRKADAQAEKEQRAERERLAEERRQKDEEDKAAKKEDWQQKHQERVVHLATYEDLDKLLSEKFRSPSFDRLGFAAEQIAEFEDEFDTAKAARLAELQKARDEKNEQLRKEEDAKAKKRAALIAKQKRWRDEHAKKLRELQQAEHLVSYSDNFEPPSHWYEFELHEVERFKKEFDDTKNKRMQQLKNKQDYIDDLMRSLWNLRGEELDRAAKKDVAPPEWKRVVMTPQELDALRERYAREIQNRRDAIERERMRGLINEYVKEITAGIPGMSNKELDELVFPDLPTDSDFTQSDIMQIRDRFDRAVKDRRRALEIERLKAGGFDELGVETGDYCPQKNGLHSLVRDPVGFYRSKRSSGKHGFGVRDLFRQLYNFAYNDGGLPWPDGHSFSGTPSTSNIDAQVLKEVRNKVKGDLGNWQEHVRDEIHRHWGNITFYVDDYCQRYKDSDFDLSTERVNRAIERHLEAVKRSGLGGWAFDDRMFDSSKVYILGSDKDADVVRSVRNFALKRIPVVVEEQYQEFMKDYPRLAPAGK